MKCVYVRGIGFWTTGYPSVTAWMENRPQPEAEKPEASLLQGPLSRRATPLTRMSVEVMQQALEMGKADAVSIAVSFPCSFRDDRYFVESRAPGLPPKWPINPGFFERELYGDEVAGS